MRIAFEIDPRSALFGALAGVAIVFGLSATQPGIVQPGSRGNAVIPQPLRIAGVPRATDLRAVQQGQPFTVPAGKLFVVTGVGLNEFAQAAEDDEEISILVDGLTVLVVGLTDDPSSRSNFNAGVSRVLSIPAGLTASAEQEVVATTRGGAAVLFGYLEDV